MRKFLILTFLYLTINQVKCQSFGEKIKFVDYLISQSLYSDAVLEMNNVGKFSNLNEFQRDTLNYLLGKSYLNYNQDSAVTYFNYINKSSSVIYNNSKFFTSYIYLNKKEITKGLAVLSQVEVLTMDEKCNKEIFEIAGLTLQNKKIADIENKDCNYLIFQSLSDNQQKLAQIKNKSPLVAGLFSFAVPGLGKVYSGKPKQGVINFFMVSALTYQSFEAYQVAGVSDARFIIYSSLASIFHIANIWGSVLSVKLTKQEAYDEIHNEIVTTIRIPIDELFDRR